MDEKNTEKINNKQQVNNQISTRTKKAGELSTTNMHILVLALRSVSKPTQQTIKLKPGEYVVGRDPTCDVIILDPYVSRRHAKISYRNGAWFIEDLGSRNGTFVNGEDIRGKGPVELKTGVEIIVGFSALTVKSFERG